LFVAQKSSAYEGEAKYPVQNTIYVSSTAVSLYYYCKTLLRVASLFIKWIVGIERCL